MFGNAKWIKSPENREEAVYVFTKSFDLSERVESAVLYISAAGLYSAFINGKKVGDDLFTPHFTAYDKRLMYQEYDVTDMLSDKNTLSVAAAEGMAAGNMTILPGKNKRYTDSIKLIYSLKIKLSSGEEAEISSDEGCAVTTSHITASSIYNGEETDKTAEIRSLGNAVVTSFDTRLVPNEGEKVTEKEIIYPVSLIKTPKGERVIDFGQNLVGYVEISVCGKRGDRIKISHGEILDSEGNFYNENLRSAKQINTYVLSGEGREVFKPVFSWQGFRYIRLDEYPASEVDLSSFRAIVVYSDIKKISDFSSGNEKINQLYHNIIWGQKGNFLDIPTDCPQRDERMGWTGDAQIFAKTAAINFDVERFFEKWLHDVAADQEENGAVSLFVPNCRLDFARRGMAAWGDAVTICTWEIYMAYGNKKILSDMYEPMKKWVDYMHSSGEEEFLWAGDKQMGDWLALDSEEARTSNNPVAGRTPKDYIASAFFAKSTEILINAGRELGKDMSFYEELYEKIVAAIRKAYFKNSLPETDTQTAYALAICFGLTDDPRKAASALSELVKANDGKLDTGFVGTPYLLHALSDNGCADTAYDLLFAEGFPSWLYSVNMGATTMWEHWDGIKEDGTVWDKVMNSYNHYAYGAVGAWLFSAAAGIRCLEDGAGYGHIEIRPHTDKRMGFLKYNIDTRRGTILTHWYYDLEDKIHFEYALPEGVCAEIYLPNGRHVTARGGTHSFICN